jgi:hypothetical protein
MTDACGTSAGFAGCAVAALGSSEVIVFRNDGTRKTIPIS